jgi:hypothetical protein
MLKEEEDIKAMQAASKIRIKYHAQVTDKQPEGNFIVNEIKDVLGLASNLIVKSDKMPGV